jgi:hypothetical protein
MSASSGKSIPELEKATLPGSQYGPFKEAVGDAVVEVLEPDPGDRYAEIAR